MRTRRRRPIVMNRYKKRPEKFGRAKRGMSVIVVLGLIGLFTVYFLENPKQEGHLSSTLAKEHSDSIKIAEVKEAPKIATETPTLQDVVKGAGITDTDTARTERAVPVSLPSTVRKAKKEDSTNTPAAENKPVERNLTEEKMNEILNDIRVEKIKTNNKANCIQVHITNTSNVANGFQVVNFLKTNGFVISGREVIKSTLQGVEINATGPCIKLTIGNL